MIQKNNNLAAHALLSLKRYSFLECSICFLFVVPAALGVCKKVRTKSVKDIE
jgi:hypothetical protein|tara:strand:+ start:565 stop:720 length:156 start_codon:yes stop_codon:yes gene_type:complete